MNGKIPALLFFAYKRVEDVILPVAKENFEIHIYREKRIGIKFRSILSCTEASLFHITAYIIFTSNQIFIFQIHPLIIVAKQLLLN